MNIKKIIPIIIAIFVAVVALSLLGSRQDEKTQVVVAVGNYPAGHTLKESDLNLADMPTSNLPIDVVQDLSLVIDETLRVARSSGDVITASHLGGESLELAADERAVSVEVADSAGLAGLLKAGDFVGVTAILSSTNGTYAKVAAEGLKVLHISPEFQALDPAEYQPAADEEGSFGGISTVPEREDAGVVTLAVPVHAVVIAYDFFAYGAEDEVRLINVIELLQALDRDQQVELSLYLMPDDALAFKTAGIFLPDLVVTPGPTPTETPTPYGWTGEATPTP